MKKLKNTFLTIILFSIVLSFNTVIYAADNIFKGAKSEINAAYLDDGYIKIKYLNPTDKKLKVIIQKGTQNYTYDLSNTGSYDIFPLQMGDGKYKVTVYENISGTKYSTKQSVSLDVKLKSANSPFLVTNQLVNYSSTSEAIKKAAELTKDAKTDIEKVSIIYDYIISNISYDTMKAKTVKSGYLPSIDEILFCKKGICFDYASAMAAMLRSQNIPAKLVTGYSSNLSCFHAWNEIYTPETGWIKLNEMYFDGTQWKLMDSTIASSAKQSNSPKYIEYTNKLIDGKYYTKQFEY